MVRMLKRMFWMVVFTVVAGCSSGSGTSTSDGVPGPTTPTTPTAVLIGGALQGISLVLTQAVTTLVSSTAGLNLPVGITTDGINLYIADSNNNVIRKVVLSSGTVTVLAGSGQPASSDGTGTAANFNHPDSITTDGTYLYVAESQNNNPTGNIRKVDKVTGVVTTLVTSVLLNSPAGITTDGTNLYVTASGSHSIHRIDISTGANTILAGSTAGLSGSTDGTGITARFNSPVGITSNGVNLYVTDFGNNTIRQIVIASGVVTTLAGSPIQTGFVDGTAGVARFTNPKGITTDGTNLYVSDYNNHTIRMVVISTGAVTTLAGFVSSTGSYADGVGAVARFNHPDGLTTDGRSLFIADSENHVIRKMN